jgi:hypothetical protein
VVYLSPNRSRSDPGPDHVRFTLHKMTLWQVFLAILPFAPVSIIPPFLRIDAVQTKSVTTSLNGTFLLFCLTQNTLHTRYRNDWNETLFILDSIQLLKVS